MFAGLGISLTPSQHNMAMVDSATDETSWWSIWPLELTMYGT